MTSLFQCHDASRLDDPTPTTIQHNPNIPRGRDALRIYPGFSHEMLTVNADVLNANLLKFVAN